MKILLTGGSGFVGKNIRESFLNEKYEICAPPHKELDCADDECVEQFFSKHSFDVVIHSATKPGHRNSPDASNLFFTNSRMILNLLKYENSWGKLINLGSGGIYDMRYYMPKMKEEYFGVHIPADEHGYNKYFTGLLFPRYKNVVDLRIFGMYGKYEDYAIRFISNAICKTLFDLPITLRQNRRFDYLYVDDLMPILGHFIANDYKYSGINTTPDETVELLRAAQIVKQVSGKQVDILIGNDGMGVEYSGDNARLRAEIKGLNFTPIEKGIEKLYKWYAANKSNIKIESLLVDK